MFARSLAHPFYPSGGRFLSAGPILVLHFSRVQGGLARFINHCCEPNCVTRVVVSEGQKRICIFAKRKIFVGEE